MKINPKDHFIVLLSLGFIITAIFIKLPVFNIRSIGATSEIKIDQTEALQLVSEQNEVKKWQGFWSPVEWVSSAPI